MFNGSTFTFAINENVLYDVMSYSKQEFLSKRAVHNARVLSGFKNRLAIFEQWQGREFHCNTMLQISKCLLRYKLINGVGLSSLTKNHQFRVKQIYSHGMFSEGTQSSERCVT